MSEEEFYTIPAISQHLGIPKNTLRDWVKKGILRPRRGKRAFAISDAAEAQKLMDTSDKVKREQKKLETKATREGNMDELRELRQRARYTKEATSALVAAKQLVSRHFAGDLMRSFMKEVREHIRGIPDKWTTRLVSEGMEAQQASDFLNKMTDEIMEDIKTSEVEDKFVITLEEED